MPEAGRKGGRQKLREELWLPLSFLGAILVGTLLLLLPGVDVDGAVGPLEAFFTATSAICVTGLIVVDTGSDFTELGQAIVLALIQVGGLGIMTFPAVAMVVARRRVSLDRETTLRETFTPIATWSVGRVLFTVFASTFVLEALGFLALRGELGDWSALFHTVSAFCNAGFSLYPDSLASQGPAAVVPIFILLILGGLGFTVLLELVRPPWHRRRARVARTSLHTRIVLLTSAGLLAVGFVTLLVLERGQPGHALFMSATARTAGFETTATGELTTGSQLALMPLMFVGGSPGSTAGGIKTTTLAVLVLLAFASLRNRERPVLFGREIPLGVLRRSFAVLICSLAVIGLVAFLLALLEEQRGREFVPVLFETVSAFGTVGLSTGLTADLGTASKLILCAAMFVGRVGSLSFFVLLVRAVPPSHVRYPPEEVLVG